MSPIQTSPSIRVSSRFAALAFFLSYMVMSIAVLSLTPLCLAPDEAYYWAWSRKLDVAYYDKGPGVALVIWMGTQLFGQTEIGVRFGAVFFQALSYIVFYAWMLKRYSHSSALKTLLLLASMPIFVQQSLFMTTDAPMAFFWLLSLWFASEAKDNAWFWLPSLACIGLAAYCKYTAAVLFPCYVIYLSLIPQMRRQMLSPGFIAGVILLCLQAVPILWWNSNNDWVNLAHNAGHVMSSKVGGFQVRRIFELAGSQLGLAGVIALPLLIYSLFHAAKRSFIQEPFETLMVIVSSCLIAVFLLVSTKKTVYANWPMPLYLSLAPLLTREIEERSSATSKYYAKALLFNLLVSIFALALMSGKTFHVPHRLLPTKQLVGWSDVAIAAHKALGQINQQSTSPGDSQPRPSDQSSNSSSTASYSSPFILTDQYQSAAELGFYMQPQPEIYVMPLEDRRMNQYDLWANWRNLTGRDALIVLRHEEHIAVLRKYFAHLLPVEQTPMVNVSYDGKPLREFYFYRGIGFQGGDINEPTRRN